MDVHVPIAITRTLRRRGGDVLTAQEDEAGRLGDPALLDRATQLGRLLFTRDDDFLAEAARRQRGGQPFSTIVFAHQMQVSLGQCVNDLELLAKTAVDDDLLNQTVYLPL
jgi:predicted nuclease of predicted toxin-antitoxin system